LQVQLALYLPGAVVVVVGKDACSYLEMLGIWNYEKYQMIILAYSLRWLLYLKVGSKVLGD
jgi:hypothetical protein